MSLSFVRGPLRMPRRFKRHEGTLQGHAYRAHYQALQDAYGPFTSPLVCEAAADCAQAHVLKLAASRAWEEAQVARQHGPQPQLVLSCALDLDGAKIVLDHAKAILGGHPELKRGVEFLEAEVRIKSTGSRWLIRSREHTSSRGLHPDLITYDEVGWAKDDELFASLLAAKSSALDPLMMVVSRAVRAGRGASRAPVTCHSASPCDH